MAERLDSDLPLSSAALHILLALAGEDLHGYGITQEIARQSRGIYKLGPGTLYDNLQKLVQGGWVQELGPRRKMILAGAITGSPILGEVSSEPRPRA
jgi:DNA-binding PadR family transcriptional regulator